MKRKGFDFKFARHLDWRYPLPEEKDADGDVIPRGYPVIVSRRAAEKIAEAEGIELFDAIRKTPALKMHGHVRSNMIYGAWRKRRGYLYWTCPVYWVEDGKVFTSTYHTYENPHTGANNE